MPYDAPGERVQRTAGAILNHGLPAVVGGQVGWVGKVSQLTRYQDPTAAAVKQVQVGEAFTFFVHGVHELPLTGAYAGAAVGDKLWIAPATNAVHTNAGAAAGDLPLGVVDEVDATRSPAVGRVNLDAWQAFFPHA